MQDLQQFRRVSKGKLARWLASPAWTDATPYTGEHNQPPVSGEIVNTDEIPSEV